MHQPGLFEGWNIMALALPEVVQQLLCRVVLLLPACLPACPLVHPGSRGDTPLGLPLLLLCLALRDWS